MSIFWIAFILGSLFGFFLRKYCYQKTTHDEIDGTFTVRFIEADKAKISIDLKHPGDLVCKSTMRFEISRPEEVDPCCDD